MLTKTIAGFVSETNYEQLPQDVIAAVKRAVVDFFGVALAGAGEDTSRIITAYVKEIGGTGEAGVIGAGIKTAPPLAALANGTTGHALDYDDCFTVFPIHPSVAILPAVLAIAEKAGTPGKKAIEAYALGFEVACQVGTLVGIEHRELGWHNTSTMGAIGAAMAAGKLLGLDACRLRTALGISASLAGGLRQNFGSMTKPLHAGNAARNGAMAALLAKKGFTAHEGILEAPLGFFNVFGGKKARDLPSVAEKLGNPYSIVSPGMTFKLYPSCHGTHRGIDAALLLREEHNIRGEEVIDVECRTSPTVPTSLFHHRPKTPTEARFSMEYCLARALLDGQLGLAQFEEEKIAASDVRSLIDKVHYSHPRHLEGVGSPQEVVIKLRDGRTCSKEVDIIRGDARNPLGLEELCVKYRDCAGRTASRQKAERLLELLLNLETVDNISECMQLATNPA